MLECRDSIMNRSMNNHIAHDKYHSESSKIKQTKKVKIKCVCPLVVLRGVSTPILWRRSGPGSPETRTGLNALREKSYLYVCMYVCMYIYIYMYVYIYIYIYNSYLNIIANLFYNSYPETYACLCLSGVHK